MPSYKFVNGFPVDAKKKVIGLHHRYAAIKTLLPHARTGMRTRPVLLPYIDPLP
jgi:hypothetical protein